MTPPLNGLDASVSIPLQGAPGQPIHVDFSQVEDVESFVSIPEGRYLCRIAEVREGETRDGALRWALRLEVAEGEYAGRTGAWDGLVWSERGLARVKHVLGVLGLDTTGNLEVQPADLLGRLARVDLFVEEWQDQRTGRRTERLAVPYLGYEPAEDPGTPF
jgi:hypothetical protein